MTDNEIIKALECHSQSSDSCGSNCPYLMCEEVMCTKKLSKDALDLINCQKAEIERLHSEVKEKTETIDFLKDQSVGWSIDFCNLKAKLNTAKAEAVKEFAERLKEHKIDVDVSFGYGKEVYTEAVAVIEIDNLVKEMVGEGG